jgi:hypothetical protein
MAGTRALQRTTLQRMMDDGLLDESDGDEVAGTLELLAEKFAQGDITEHFALNIIEKLAVEQRAKYVHRLRWGDCVDVESEVVPRG